ITMRASQGLSRRDLLVLAGRTAGGLVVTGGLRGAGAQQAAQGSEQMDPAHNTIIASPEPIRQLATGYGGDIGPAEGPVWVKEGHHLLFNDIHPAARSKYTPGQRAAVA